MSEPDSIQVACPCGNSHSFAARYAGRLARCPVADRQFRIPSASGNVAFIATAQDATADESAPEIAGSIVKAASSLLGAAKNLAEKRKEKLARVCNCPHCKKRNDVDDFMCSACGCPLQDQQAAFLFMEKRRQEEHELRIAETRKRPTEHRRVEAISTTVSRPAPVIQQKIVVNQRSGSGCLSIIGAVVLILLIAFVLVPMCAVAVSQHQP